MLTLRTLAIAVAAAGVLAALPARSAQACDNDRYPCPVVAQPQEADAAVRSPSSRKKASRAAPQDEKARAKTERQTSQAPSQTDPEQATNAASRKERGVVPARNEQVGRNERSAAAAAWPSRPGAAGTGAQGAAGEQNALIDDATPTVPASGVKMVDPNELNELDLAAAPTTPAESSWLSSLLATLGAALAAASTVRFLFG
jgi:hypothetical protein